MGAQAERVFPIFFGVWVVLGIFSASFFFLNGNAALKRKVWPPFVVGTGLLFLFFIWLMGMQSEILFAAPFVIIITLINIKSVKFCSSCGKTIMNHNPFAPPKYCSKCGAALESPDV
jgi:membrane protein CcdC involved in cytochrome C biogenesis